MTCRSGTMLDSPPITLSIILRVVGGAPFVRRCLDRLSAQTEDRPIEIIVPYDSSIPAISAVAREFPEVKFIDMGHVSTAAAPGTHAAAHELYDRRTAAGLAVARGEIVALLEDYGVPREDWCDNILEAHKLPYGAIGGPVDHCGSGILNWAVYFVDFARYQPPLQEGRVNYLSDVNVTYKRATLDAVKRIWANSYNEVLVHWALAKRGVDLWLRPQIVVCEDRGALQFAELVKERFAWGRLFGSIRAREMMQARRAVYIILGPALPMILLARMAKAALGRSQGWRPFLAAFPVTVLLTLIWSLGEVFGYVTGRSCRPSAPAPSSAVSHANRC